MEIDHESESEQKERSNHIVLYIQNPYLELATALRKELDSFQPFSGQCTIHRVRQGLRQLDEKAYTPRLVSIGPIHHGTEELKAMEEYKRRYVQNFLRRTKVPLEDFIKVIKEKEAEVRNCYAETVKLNSNDFVKMILIDAAFIFEALLIRIRGKEIINDRIHGHPRMRYDVMDDLYMLENQLPFFILVDLFTLANIHMSSNKDEKLSFLEIIHTFTRYRWEYLGVEETFDKSKYTRVKHLLDFLRICIVPSNSPMNERPEILTTPSVTELQQAGVKFKLGSSKNFVVMWL